MLMNNSRFIVEVNIIVGTGHGVRLFSSRLYEVTVFENRLAPLWVLNLNATDEIAHKPVLYSIVGHDYNGLFVMEADTGRLTVTASLDREKRDRYSLKVRAENVGRHRFGREISRSGKAFFPFLHPVLLARLSLDRFLWSIMKWLNRGIKGKKQSLSG
ncbi:cadherin-89D [Caerostris darwini]|uniref:Cadherin-89D n=1 Tax=Caerostris darwini TaxID=1538125 RepID=A0AAV4V1D5_9ARAC|nr:cadherin-89D [Caerostris darwini]